MIYKIIDKNPEIPLGDALSECQIIRFIKLSTKSLCKEGNLLTRCRANGV